MKTDESAPIGAGTFFQQAIDLSEQCLRSNVNQRDKKMKRKKDAPDHRSLDSSADPLINQQQKT